MCLSIFEKSILFTSLLLIFIGCNISESDGIPPGRDSVLTITLNPEQTYQTIDGFGASDAWSIQFVGKNWPVYKRNKIADLLFSNELDSTGQPEGIDLSIWRFNIGAGSARQGESSGISDPWRRAESFLAADSSYDWDKQSGQQWFLNAAKNRGVNKFIGFVNSPPVLLTKNGKAYGNGSPNANIDRSNYEEYADYLAKIALYFRKEGVSLDYLSPANEPQWDWSRDNGQEGSPWQNKELAQFTEQLDKTIQEYDLNTKIVIPEAGEIDYLFNGNISDRGEQIEYFFGSNNSLIDLSGISQKIAAHSYFTTWPIEDMIEHRMKLINKIRQAAPEIDYWMSEYCILADNNEIQGNGRDIGMDPALYVARLIHYDLTIADATSWQWWLAVSPYDYKDGLIYIDKNTENGQVMDSKLLWALGNYSRFITPGTKRIGINRSDRATPLGAASRLMVSAYQNNTNDKITVVIINYSRHNRSIKLHAGSDALEKETRFTPYITSSNYKLHPLKSVTPEENLEVPARSIITLTNSD